LSGFPGNKILVIGDLMVDEFLWGDVSRISPEAPVPVVSVTKKTRMPGGAGNVVNNLRTLGADVYVVGVVGKDTHGRELISMLRKKRLRTDGIIVDDSRMTTLKTRIIAKSQHVVRVDTENTVAVGRRVLNRMISYVKKTLPSVDALAISDYGKGVISEELLEYVIPAARKRGIPIVVDPKLHHFFSYRNVTVVTPNEHEASLVCGVALINETSIRNIGFKILSQLDSDYVLITRGLKGMSLFGKDGKVTHIPAQAREVFDVTGAGDTVTSVLTLALSCGADMLSAACLANYAAGIVVGKIGTATVTRDEIIKELHFRG
jgi:D-beta-D-heptose 7-phosphate kinase/D-beta-D-heptose 1-phosphate adenosyltransferase